MVLVMIETSVASPTLPIFRVRLCFVYTLGLGHVLSVGRLIGMPP
jgi:hypothetical protein